MLYQNVNDICCSIGLSYNTPENTSKQRKGDRCVQDISGIKFIPLSGEYEAFLSIPVLSNSTDNRTQVGLALTFFGWIVAQQQVSTVVLWKLHESGHLKQTSYSDRTCLKTSHDCSLTQTYIVCFFLQVIKHDLPDQQNCEQLFYLIITRQC